MGATLNLSLDPNIGSSHACLPYVDVAYDRFTMDLLSWGSSLFVQAVSETSFLEAMKLVCAERYQRVRHSLMVHW
jgi:hypothetical protein